MTKDMNNIKCVLFDFDDTLAIHKNHASSSEDEKILYLAEIIGEKYTWPDAIISKHMKIFMDYCKKNNKEMFLISSSPATESIGKVGWVEKNYGYKLHNCCVDMNEKKTQIAKSIAKAYNVNLNEILIVDDFHSVLTNAEDLGIPAASPMEIVNFVEEQLKNAI